MRIIRPPPINQAPAAALAQVVPGPGRLAVPDGSSVLERLRACDAGQGGTQAGSTGKKEGWRGSSCENALLYEFRKECLQESRLLRFICGAFIQNLQSILK